MYLSSLLNSESLRSPDEINQTIYLVLLQGLEERLGFELVESEYGLSHNEATHHDEHHAVYVIKGQQREVLFDQIWLKIPEIR